MSNSLNLIGSLAQERHAERYGSSLARSSKATGSQQADTRTHTHATAKAHSRETTRRRAGWLLIGLGLRLVSSGPGREPVNGRPAG